MICADLMARLRDEFSQHGEDGLLESLFEKIGPGNRTCCEFGAWDGIHFSNTRRLVLAGWTGVFIEGDPAKFESLTRTYAGTTNVSCLQAFVDAEANRLAVLLGERARNLDLLSVDIDGLDFEILEHLDIRPRVILIEVNGAHAPDRSEALPREIARGNVGQPLGWFSAAARRLGYGLVAYTSNAVYVRDDVLAAAGIRPVPDLDAYGEFLRKIDVLEREWLFLACRGLVTPWHDFDNRWLTAAALGIPPARAAWLLSSGHLRKAARIVYRTVRRR